MSDERINLLLGIPIFGGMSKQALVFLLDRSTLCEVAEGTTFFEEGDDAESMFILEDGVVSVSRQWEGEPVILHPLKSGDCFGEIALMEMMPRSATIKADCDCKAIELPRAALFELYQTDLEQFVLIQMNMGREICRRLRYADDSLFAFHQSS